MSLGQFGACVASLTVAVPVMAVANSIETTPITARDIVAGFVLSFVGCLSALSNADSNDFNHQNIEIAGVSSTPVE